MAEDMIEKKLDPSDEAGGKLASSDALPVEGSKQSFTMNTALSPPPLTIDEVAERWHYSADSVRRLIRAGKLPCIRVGPRKVLVPFEDVEAYEQTARLASLSQADQTTETATLGLSSGASAAGPSASEQRRAQRMMQKQPSKAS